MTAAQPPSTGAPTAVSPATGVSPITAVSPTTAASPATGASTAGSPASGAPSASVPEVSPRIATVRLDTPLPHLDRPFDYSVPPSLVTLVMVGSRVRVRFSGRLANAVVTGLASASTFSGELSEIRSASATPSFTPAAIRLAERIARRYGGSVWDVLRLMAPPRVAAVEKREWALPGTGDQAAGAPAVAPIAPGTPTSGTPPLGMPARDAAELASQSGAREPTPTKEDAPDPYVAAQQELTRDAAPNSTSADSAHSEWPDYECRLLSSPSDRVIWEALPDVSRRTSIATGPLVEAALQVVVTGASAVLVVPDARAVAALLKSFTELGLRRWTTRSGGEVAVLDHGDGPAVRFGNYLAAMHGHARIVIGTRPSAMQPVPKLGLIAVWDEANGALEDPHAPYPHARTVAAMRAEDGGALILGGYALSAEAIALVEHGWARLESPSRDQVREAVPAMDVLTAERRDAEGGSGWHWLPGSVWRSLRTALDKGPVAIIVPRAGYVRATACARCEAWAQCRECSSLLGLPSPGADPVCLDEQHPQPDWHCPECQGSALKHVRQGAERIAEQLERMLGDTPLTVSTAAAGIVADHAVAAGVVLATPSALPAVAGGYAHLAIIDAGLPAGLGLGGELKAIRWWLNAAALVRSRRDGGAVTIVGEVPPAVRRALSSWTPAEAAHAEYQERGDIGLPPHRRYVTVQGPGDAVTRAVRQALEATGLAGDSTGAATEVPLDGGSGMLLPRSRTQAAVDSLRASVMAASKDGGELRLRVDGPLELPR